MTLNELLARYADLDEAAQAWADQEGCSLGQARFIVAIAAQESDGDCVTVDIDGTTRPTFPLDKE